MLEEGYLSTVFEKMASIIAERSFKEFWEPLFLGTWLDINPGEKQGDLSQGKRKTSEENRIKKEPAQIYCKRLKPIVKDQKANSRNTKISLKRKKEVVSV